MGMANYLLRPIVESDVSELADFDLGTAKNHWVSEVSEIVGSLTRWQADPARSAFRRQAIALVHENQIIAVAAHEAKEALRGTIDSKNRYLMVVAVRSDYRRIGVAELVMSSVFESLAAGGTQSIQWLAHPRNSQSIALSRTKFPEADETYPPEDKPYVSFTLWL
jgi:ribosomal protein S18 acetylase RimI-like enzyme